MKLIDSIGKFGRLFKKTVNQQKVEEISMAPNKGNDLSGKSTFKEDLKSNMCSEKTTSDWGTSMEMDVIKSSFDNLSSFPEKQIFSSQQNLPDECPVSQAIPPGVNFSLLGMYTHFQVGGGDKGGGMTIKASSLDFSRTSQRQLGLNGMKPGEKKSISLFDSGINSNSLAFGKVDMVYEGNNQFSILSNKFDFDIEWNNVITARNAGTVLGGIINYNLWSPVASLIPKTFGGPYCVYFEGTVTIPE